MSGKVDQLVDFTTPRKPFHRFRHLPPTESRSSCKHYSDFRLSCHWLHEDAGYLISPNRTCWAAVYRSIQGDSLCTGGVSPCARDPTLPWSPFCT